MTSRTSYLRIAAVGASALLALTATACAETTGGSGSPATAAANGSGSGGSGGTVKPASSISELAATLVASASHGTTVHLTLSTSGAGATAESSGNGSGDVLTKDGGGTQAFSFAIGSGSTGVTIVYVDGTGYVKLPAGQATDPSKPWAQISESSANPVVKAIAGAFDMVDNQTSLSQYAALVKGATDFEDTGPSSVGGVTVEGYSFSVDPKNLPSAAQLGSVVDQLGPIPTTMALDQQGRLVQVTEKVTFAGQTITTAVGFSKYGESLDITAPPADQIGD